MTWLTIIGTAVATGLGLLLAGHKRGRKVAARLAQVLALARDAAYLVGQVLRAVGQVTAAEVIAKWSAAFADALATAGLDITEAQHSAAVDEARRTLGRYAVAAGAEELRRAVDKFEVAWPALKAQIDEQALVRARATARHEAKVRGAGGKR